MIKLRAIDGAEAVYTLIVTQEGNPDSNLANIHVYDAAAAGDSVPIKQRISQDTGFAPAVYAYDVKMPNGTTTAYVEPTGPANSIITYSIVGGDTGTYSSGCIAVPNVSPDDSQVLNIDVQPQGGGGSTR